MSTRGHMYKLHKFHSFHHNITIMHPLAVTNEARMLQDSSLGLALCYTIMSLLLPAKYCMFFSVNIFWIMIALF